MPRGQFEPAARPLANGVPPGHVAAPPRAADRPGAEARAEAALSARRATPVVARGSRDAAPEGRVPPGRGTGGPASPRPAAEGRAADASPVGAWAARADELAGWADRVLVNRRDAFGQYREVAERRDKNLTARTRKAELTPSVLRRHFRGDSAGHLVGLHSTAVEVAGDGGASCRSRWLGIDIDRHDEETDPGTTRQAALTLYDRAARLGFEPLLIDSNGRGGYHLWIIFGEPIPTAHAYRLGKWLCRDWRDLGLDRAPETFPRQEVVGPGRYGNWLRLPGRHHTLDHFSRVWDGGRWLEGDEAVDALLKATGVSPSVIPAEALEEPTASPARGRPERGRAFQNGNDPEKDVALARDALGYLADLADDHDPWIKIGMCLTPLGPAGLALWIEWSRSSAKFKEGECESRWRSFRRDDGLGLGTLFNMARARGWQFPDAGPRILRRADRARNGHAGGNGHRGGAGRAGHGDGHHEAEAPPAVFANFAWAKRNGKADDGSEQEDVKQPLRAREILEASRAIAPGWPKSAGGVLFVESDSGKPRFLDSSTKLFSWYDQVARVDWQGGGRFVTQDRYYEYLRQQAEAYHSIETLPHWPRMSGVYYMHPEIPLTARGPAGSSYLDGLIEHFRTDGLVDSELIRAFILTLFWGGAPGKRPAFLITGPDHDKQQGRGIGKTRLVEVLAEGLCGSFLDVGTKDDIGDVKTRLLSAAGRSARVVRLDNVKTSRLSWADLESLITSATISGRALYQGEGQRPNTVVWAITLNAASLSKDMSQRCIPIKLARPTFSPTWDDDVTGYIRRHRVGILAEIREALESPPPPAMGARTRWPVWERDVLSRTADPDRCREVILERQGDVDDDRAERDEVRCQLAEWLEDHGHDPQRQKIAIRSQVLADRLAQIIRQQRPANKLGAYFKNIDIPELTGPVRSTNGKRVWYWTGKDAPENASPINLDEQAASVTVGGR